MSNDARPAMLLSRNTQHCFVCGPLNPAGLHIPFARDGESGARGEYVVLAEHCGWPGILHGGIVFALMDEALAYALYYQGLFGVTARADTRFREPIRQGSQVVVRSWVVERRRRIILAKAEIRLGGESASLLAETNATMFLQEAAPPSALT